MIKNTAKKIGFGMIISLISLLSQLINFVVANHIAKILGIETFGMFGIIQFDLAVFMTIAELGSTSILINSYVKSNFSNSRLISSLQVKILINISAAFAYSLYLFVVRQAHPSFNASLYLIPTIIINTTLVDFYLISSRSYKKYAAIKLLQSLLYLSCVFGLSKYGKIQNISHITMIMSFSNISSGLAGILLVKNFHLLFTLSGNYFLKTLSLIKKSFPITLSGLSSYFLFPAGLIFLDIFISDKELLGAYNASHKLIWIASGFMILFVNTSLTHKPEFKSDRNYAYLKESVIYVAFILPIVVITWISAKEILGLLYFGISWNEKSLNFAVMTLRFLSLSLIFQAFRINLIAQYIQSEKTYIYMCITFAVGLANILICYIMCNLGFALYLPIICLTGDIILNIYLSAHIYQMGKFKFSIAS